VSVIDQVTRELSRLPGVGPRTATRLVYHMMRGSPDDARGLAQAILELVERVRPCRRCGSLSEDEECEVCRDPSRDHSLVCVVESAFDVRSIDRTGEFRGVFHVLGGRLSPLDGIGPEELRVAPLVERVREEESPVREVILATNPSVEGEATAVYLEGLLRPLGVKVTRPARGLPVGSDLEYVDGSTLAEALAGRKEM
jgi:recombination protein RecR